MLISSIFSTCHLHAIFGFQSNSYMMSLHVEIMSQNLCTVAKLISSLIMHQSSSSIFVTSKTPSGMKKHHECTESEICKMIFILLAFLRILSSVWLAQCCCNLSWWFDTHFIMSSTFSQLEINLTKLSEHTLKLWLHLGCHLYLYSNRYICCSRSLKNAVGEQNKWSRSSCIAS